MTLLTLVVGILIGLGSIPVAGSLWYAYKERFPTDVLDEHGNTYADL